MSKSLFPDFKVLLVDDEPAFLRSLSITLERLAGISNVLKCEDSREVMPALSGRDVGLVLLDLTMPHFSGEELLEQIGREYPEVAVIVISGMNQVEIAVRCMKQGAIEYFVKTDDQERIVEGVKRAIKMQELQRENEALREKVLGDPVSQPEAFDKIVTVDSGMQAIFRYLESVASSQQPILLQGESGVGKELFAEAVHRLSQRSGPLVTVNVAGLDDNLFADTLFGHVKGAYTGANSRRAGMVEKAADGTLFLDEIGDLSIASQVKLLRLLQEGEYYAIGSDKPARMRARVVFATHQNLIEKQRSGEFRKDLYYRLRTHQVTIPALRERKADIPQLLDHFIQLSAGELGKQPPAIPPQLLVLLENYSFPGNIRELKAMVHDAMSVHQSRVLSMDVFKRSIDVDDQAIEAEGREPEDVFAQYDRLPSLAQANDLLVREAMQRSQGNQSIAARLLGISQPALSKRLKKLQP